MNNFIYEHKVYALIHEITFNPANEKIILFKDLNSIQTFFKSVSMNPLASEDLLTAAKWAGISFFTSCSNQSPQKRVQHVIEHIALTMKIKRKYCAG